MTRRHPDFSKRLAGEIARNGWSKRDFARKVGIHENSINKYTLHGGVPKWDTLVSMARELDCSVEWLLSGIDHRIESRADLPTPPVSFPEIRRIGEERRSTHKLAGVKAPDAQILAAWFARDPEARDILLAWARARASGRIADDLAEKVEVQAKAMALYVLGKYAPAAKLDGTT